MNEIIANWTKLCIGIAALIITVSFALGHISAQDFLSIIGAALGLHATVSGVSSFIAGPTANKDVTVATVETNTAKAAERP